VSEAIHDPVTARLEKCYTGAVHDVMRAMGHVNFVLPSDIRPLFPQQRLCGPVFTMNGRVDTGADAHMTLMGWTGFLSRAPAGHVVVCQANDDRVAHMGELSAETLKIRGVRGYIVDGGCRDVEFVLGIGFQVFCRYFTPSDVVGYWVPDAFDVAVSIGDVIVHPGDYVLGDRDGVCVLPRAHADEIVTAAEQAISTESAMRDAILGGMDPQQAYLKYGKF
jgi:4-hydroxy-4-methyl-2-oxoglutarate aldolase